jgi:gliding motility-associated-like protein
MHLPRNFIEFVENKGQWESNVLFKADIPIGHLFIEKDRITYLFVDKEATHELQHGKDIKKIHFHSVRMKLQGANLNPSISRFEPSEAYYNYFIGDASKHATNVYGYKKIILHNVYAGIDMEVLSRGNSIKINFVVKPGANPNQIALEYQGADKLQLQNNQLKIETSLGTLIEGQPVSFQHINGAEKTIKTKYQLEGNILRFKTNNYQKFNTLIIDPEVVFGTYMGSAADNFGFAASYDLNGNALGAGTVYAANFPTTTGAFDVSYAGGSDFDGEYARDAFIAKFNSTGSTLLFASFIGGTNNEQPHSVTTVPATGDIIIFGTTQSDNFPVSPNGHDKTHGGAYDIFVTKLSANGNQLLASTYFGGINDDGITGNSQGNFSSQPHNLHYNYADCFRGEVIVDLSGNIIIASVTKSSHLQGVPMLNSAQPIYGGGAQDGLLIKYNANLSAILFSTFIGGNNADAAYSVCVNKANEILVGGGTISPNLGFSSSFNPQGGTDGFIGKYGSNGVRQRIIYTGTSAYDQVFFVATDDNNLVYAMGQTEGNMPLSPQTFGIPNAKHFVQQYNSDLTQLTKSTTFGKANATKPSLAPSAFMVDKCGRIYISGWGGGTNQSYQFGLDNLFGFQTSNDAFQKTTDGSDFYLMVLSPNFGSLLYATYYGGSTSQEHVDGGTSHFDPSGIVYQSVCAGCGGFNDFPTTATAYSKINPGKRTFNTNVGGCNLGMFKFDMRTYLLPPKMLDTILYVSAGKSLEYDFYASDAGGDMLTMKATGDILSKVPNPASLSVISSTPGLLWGRLNWQSLCSDLGADTFRIEVTVEDAACPLPNFVTATIKIVLQTDTLDPPFPQCLKAVDDNNLFLDWVLPNPSDAFGKYLILRSVNDSPMEVYDSVLVQAATNYLDIKANQNFENNYCFQLVTLNSCGIAGDTSRKICSYIPIDSSNQQVYFTNLETEIIQLNAYDTFFRQYMIASLEPKDSVFIKLNGEFKIKNYGNTATANGLGTASATISWVPDCSHIGKDTIELLIQVRDNTCPLPKTGVKRVLFLVDPIPQPKSPRVNCPVVISGDSIRLDWPVYPANRFTKELYLFREINGVKQQIASFSNVGTITYLDVFKFDPSKTTCYSLSSSDICGYHSDTSSNSCVAFQPIPNENLRLYTVSVQNDKEIKLTWQAAKADSFWRYLVYRKEGRLGFDFEKVGEIRNLNDTQFIDSRVDVDKTSYCYKLVNVDLCGNPSVNDKEACSIVLSGTSAPFVHSLNWLPFEYWEKGTEKYELYRTEPGINADQLIKTTQVKNTFAVDDVLNYDNGLYLYKVIAHENPDGYEQISESNVIDLIQAPIVYAPNAYTENGDGLNDKFETVPVFVKDYYIQIFNRWGERIFESRSKYDYFDGSFKGKESQSDVYFYIIQYSGWNGLEYTKKGNFTILR